MVSPVTYLSLPLVVALAMVLGMPSTQAAVLHGETDVHKFMKSRGDYLQELNPELVALIQQGLPEIHDIRIIEGPDGPKLDMPLSGCRDSKDCHHRFTNYLGMLVRMMETGKRRK